MTIRGTKVILFIWVVLELFLVYIYCKGVLYFDIKYLNDTNIRLSELISYSLGIGGFLFGVYKYFDLKEMKDNHKKEIVIINEEKGKLFADFKALFYQIESSNASSLKGGLFIDIKSKYFSKLDIEEKRFKNLDDETIKEQFNF